MSNRMEANTEAMMESRRILDHYLFRMPEELLGYITGWQPYTGWRIKMFHDIKLKDGTIIENCWPNADEWNCQYHDDEVSEIRISKRGGLK